MTRTGAYEPSGYVGGGRAASVLSIKPFKRLWIAFALSSLGDWLSVLALTALAAGLAGRTGGYQGQAYAVGGVLVLRLLPSVVFGPMGGAIAGMLDRRLAMAIADLLRFGLLLSVPLVGRLDWLLVATFLVGFVSLWWSPAKDATIPYLVPGDRLAQAEQISLRTRYGSAPVAAVLFSVLALIFGAVLDGRHQVDLVLYVNAVVFLLSAVAVFSLGSVTSRDAERVAVPSALKQVAQGWRSSRSTPVPRGAIIGLVGAALAGGVVVAVARVYVQALAGGNAAYGVVFTAVFVGLAFGVFLGPRMLAGFSRHRLFGLSVVFAGLMLIPIALIANLVVVVFLTAFLGVGVGVAGVVGHTLVDLELSDEQRGRTLTFLTSLARVTALLVFAVAPPVAGVIGTHLLTVRDTSYRFDGANAVLLLAAVVTLLFGLLAYRKVDDRRAIPLGRDLAGALRGVPYVAAEPVGTNRGVLIAFEGGEGAGKTTQSRLTAIWLRDNGYEVVTTREPGSTKVGMRLRAILLDKEMTGLSSRAETLLYAADRADHVDGVIAPALRRGAVVVSDRYIDSTLAYQGYGRSLPVEEIFEINKWATAGLLPDLTVLLDVPPEVGFDRFASPADRIESEPPEFHERVRRGFRALAEAEPHRYLVVDASKSQPEITREIQDRVRAILPDPVPQGTEDNTSTFPAITDA